MSFWAAWRRAACSLATAPASGCSTAPGVSPPYPRRTSAYEHGCDLGSFGMGLLGTISSEELPGICRGAGCWKAGLAARGCPGEALTGGPVGSSAPAGVVSSETAGPATGAPAPSSGSAAGSSSGRFRCNRGRLPARPTNQWLQV